MKNRREMGLISAAIDGALDLDEQAELDLLLETSKEARELKVELEQLDSVLNDVPDLEPPESLHANVVARAKLKPAPSDDSILYWLRTVVPGVGLRYALAAATGALVVAVFFGNQSMITESIDLADLVGTMAPDVDSVNEEIIDSFGIHEAGLEGLIQLRRRDSVLLLDIHSETEMPVDISIDVGDAGLWPDALAQIEGRTESIAIVGQALQIEVLGTQRMTILLRRVDGAALAGEANITLEFSSKGNLLQRGSLTATLEGVGQ
jgi:hypothetical protein